MIRKDTKNNDGNAYEANASTDYFVNNLVVDENSLVWLETIVGQGRRAEKGTEGEAKEKDFFVVNILNFKSHQRMVFRIIDSGSR